MIVNALGELLFKATTNTKSMCQLSAPTLFKEDALTYSVCEKRSDLFEPHSYSQCRLWLG